MMISTLLVRREYGAFQAQVDPRAIRYPRTAAEWPKYVKRWPFLVCPGNWDEVSEEYEPFRESLMRKLFVEGRHYTETEVYQWLVKLQAEGKTTRDFPSSSMEEITRYFEGVIRLGTDIRERGLLSPASGGEGPRDGITVRVARDGSLLKCGEGTHRLAIARVLELPHVPVVIDLVHTGWAREKCIRQRGKPGRQVLQEALARLGG